MLFKYKKDECNMHFSFKERLQVLFLGKITFRYTRINHLINNFAHLLSDMHFKTDAYKRKILSNENEKF